MGEFDELVQEFLEEARDIIDGLHQAIDSAKGQPGTSEPWAEIFRGVHTLKGAASMFQMTNEESLCHQLESQLAEIKSQPAPVDNVIILQIRKEIDRLEGMLFPKVEPENIEVSIESARTGEEFVRVPLGRINDTLSGVLEAFMIRNQIKHLVDRHRMLLEGANDFLREWEVLDTALRRTVGELERTTMSMRMVPIKGLFTRMGRIVEQYAHESGEPIDFHVAGEDTELDKKITDVLAEPLVHLIRNAMDHGIEESIVRRGLGKSPIGQIRLQANTVGNEILIEVKDDGKGIDAAHILQSAREKGLNVENISTEAEALDLIFTAGFSTSAQVTNVSGRGIGMDAVKAAIADLGGEIHLATKPGEGTTFRIQIPTGVSVVPVILVGIGDQTYAINTHDLAEARRFSVEEFKVSGHKQLLLYRDKFIPCFDLEQEFVCAKTRVFDVVRHEIPVCVVRQNNEYVAFCVSELFGNTELVLQSLPKASPDIPFLNGVSVLSDGRPIFVMSMGRLFELLRRGGIREGYQNAEAA